MSNEIEILTARANVSIGNETITINELAWPDAIEFLKKLSDSAGKFVQNGNLIFSIDRLTEIVTSTTDLSEWLILKTTGKDHEWLKQRTFGEVLDLIDAALSRNVRPDFFDKLSRIRSRLTAAWDSRQPSTSSSGRDTTAAT